MIVILSFLRVDTDSKEEGELEGRDSSDEEVINPIKAGMMANNPIVQVSNINPDEIPDVPKNKSVF